MIDIDKYLNSYKRSDYQRENFDAFLNKINFKFNIPAIHIAGTNGKGSTAHYLNEILIENNYKTGIFSTPDEFNESIKISNKTIRNEYIENIINDYEKLFKKYDLSAFEIQTFIAFKYFIDENVDIAIIECGMGGELDATNIFTPIVSIITSITIEHSMFLGDSLSEIAAHKAGIIKPGIPVVVGNVSGDALDVVINKCKYENAKLIMVDNFHNRKDDANGIKFDYRPYTNLFISNLTEYSVIDACLAIEALNQINNRFPLKEDLLKNGLKKMKLKCRFEVVRHNPIVVLDGAHNPEAIKQLRNEFDHNFGGFKVNIVFASFKDKSIANMLPEINLLGDIYLTTFNHQRARKEEDYFIYLSDYKFYSDYKLLIKELLTKDEIILVTGSLAFCYEVRQFFQGLTDEKI